MGILKQHLQKLSEEDKKYLSEIMRTSGKLIAKGRQSEAMKYLDHNRKKATQHESNISK